VNLLDDWEERKRLALEKDWREFGAPVLQDYEQPEYNDLGPQPQYGNWLEVPNYDPAIDKGGSGPGTWNMPLSGAGSEPREGYGGYGGRFSPPFPDGYGPVEPMTGGSATAEQRPYAPLPEQLSASWESVSQPAEVPQLGQIAPDLTDIPGIDLPDPYQGARFGARAEPLPSPIMPPSPGGIRGFLSDLGGYVSDVGRFLLRNDPNLRPGDAPDAYVGVANIAPALMDAYNTDIPGVSPFLRETVQPAVGGAFRSALENLASAVYPRFPTPSGYTPPSQQAVGIAGDIGQFIGETQVPVTAGDLALTALPFMSEIGRGARNIAAFPGRIFSAGENIFEPRVIRLAVRPEALGDLPGPPSLAGSTGSKVISGPGARVLGEGEALLPGEVEMFHGTATPFEGVPRVGSYVTPDPGAAQTFAKVSAGLQGEIPSTPLSRPPFETTRPVVNEPIGSLLNRYDRNPTTVRKAAFQNAVRNAGLDDSGTTKELAERLRSHNAQADMGGGQPPREPPAPPTGGQGAFFGGEVPRQTLPPQQPRLGDETLQQVLPTGEGAGLEIPPLTPPEGLSLSQQRLYRAAQEPSVGPSVPAREGAPQLLMEGQRAEVPRASLADHVFTWWQNSILSASASANALGNTAFTLSRLPERALAAAIDVPLHRAPWAPRDTARFFEEVPADAVGMAQGLPKGVRSALRVLKTGESMGPSKYDTVRAFEKGITGRAVRAPTTINEANDALNFEVAFNGAKEAEIIRQARSEGRKGQALVERIAELQRLPTPRIIENATREAEYRLFRDDPGKIGSALMQAQKNVPGLRYVAPFVRTPANLLGAGLERSPLGLANRQLWSNIAKGNPEAADQLSRIAFGSSIGAGMAAMVANGTTDITGAAPQNAAERDRFYREGKQPYSIRVGDRWVQYQRLEPFNQPLAQLAAVVEFVRDRKDKSATEAAWQMAETLGNNLTSQTYLSGLSNFLDVLDNPSRYGERFAGRLFSGFVPASSAVREVTQATDPVYRDPRSLTEQFKTGIPGLSQQVPPRLTAFGEESSREGLPFSPINVTTASQSDVDRALEELSAEVGFVGNTISNIPLSREQQYLYQEGAGRNTYTLLNALVNSNAWDELGEGEKLRLLTKAVTASRDRVRGPVNDTLGKMLDSDQFKALTPAQQSELLQSQSLQQLLTGLLNHAVEQAK